MRPFIRHRGVENITSPVSKTILKPKKIAHNQLVEVRYGQNILRYILFLGIAAA
jgi:hypothetical protein